MANELAAMAIMPSGGHDYSCHDLRPADHHMLQSHRQTNMGCLLPNGSARNKPALLARKFQFRRAGNQVTHHQRSHNDLGKNRSQSSSFHSQACPRHPERAAEQLHIARREYQEEIEYDIKHTHQYVQHTRNTHIAAAPEHASGQKVQLQHRQEKRKNEKVQRRIAPYNRISSQPTGGSEPLMATPASPSSRLKTKTETIDWRSTARALSISPAPIRCAHLHGETRSRSRTYSPKQPRCCRYQSDGSRRIGSQTSHHRRIDILHKDGRKLRHNCGHTQLDGQP